ncbi:hypothetical protein GJ689_24885 [Rhodoplanes serenus]|uniref:Uncharacterized protein n=1 Tax=Rhodoplanes serenus TaxID=200615 RepID=A0A9X4XS31_9BRAD|nr:hypothetical protein [Rhodoplanes serenus]MTW19431.1 hypothetical protein [Rhodoplanes serenus]
MSNAIQHIVHIVRALSAGEALPSLQRRAAEIIDQQEEKIATLRRTLRHLEAWAGVHEPTNEETTR